MPKEIVSMMVYTSDCQDPANPRGQIFAALWKLMLDNYLREFIYMCDMAKQTFSISRYLDHLALKWNGYSQTTNSFVEQTLDHICKMRDDQNLE